MDQRLHSAAKAKQKKIIQEPKAEPIAKVAAVKTPVNRKKKVVTSSIETKDVVSTRQDVYHSYLPPLNRKRNSAVDQAALPAGRYDQHAKPKTKKRRVAGYAEKRRSRAAHRRAMVRKYRRRAAARRRAIRRYYRKYYGYY